MRPVAVVVVFALGGCIIDFDVFDDGGAGAGAGQTGGGASAQTGGGATAQNGGTGATGTGGAAGGEPTGGGGGEPTELCEGVVCGDDGNPCTLDVCTGRGMCSKTADPQPALTQTPGDCQTWSCNGTMAVLSPDMGDVPGDDSNECTVAVCNGTTPEQQPTPGAACGTGGMCLPSGVCGSCAGDGDCPADTDCADWSCNGSNVCEKIDKPGPPTSNTTGDCKVNVCLSGVIVQMNDDSDVASDFNSCTVDGCSNGSPIWTPEAAGTQCGYMLYCTSAGTCAGCGTQENCMSNPTGTLCKSDNNCGCTDDTHCAASPLGDACRPSGYCGCNDPSDCTASSRGHDCILYQGAFAYCGCDEPADCLGIGSGSCAGSPGSPGNCY